MEVRKFESFNLQDAIKNIKADLGKDAIILSTKEKDVFLEKLGKNSKIYEIIAAKNTKHSSKVIDSKLGQNLPRANFPKIEKQDKPIVVKNAIAELKTEKKEEDHSIPLKFQENKSEISFFLREFERLRKEIDTLPHIDFMNYMKEIKIILHEIMKEKYQKECNEEDPEIMNMVIQLKVSGVNEKVIAPLLKKLKEFNNDNTLLKDDLCLNETVKYLFDKIKTSDPLGFSSHLQQGNKFICLIGPTGVGKTTMAAKLASKIKIELEDDVTLVSMDTYRVAGAEQLRVYSKIIDCGFIEEDDLQNLWKSLSKRRNDEYVIIDTAGYNPRNKEQLEILKKFEGLNIPLDFHLVLSSSIKQRDLEEIVKSYGFLNISSIIFTKLDESWSFGEMLNIASEYKIPLSYFSTGQRVPEDIEIATKERVIERILRI